MKRLLLTLLLLAFSSNLSLLAQGGPPSWAGKGQGRGETKNETTEDLVALERFLTMSDAQLDQLLQAVGKVRAMTPAQRSTMKKQMVDYRSLTPEQRDQVRAGWGWQSEQDRSDWPVMMHSKNETDRTAIQVEIQALLPEKRAARKHALLEQWRQLTGKQ